jgi:DNA-binding PadR family transcriptional regulator
MSAEYALLGLLLEGSKHGYDLARQFAPEAPLGEICDLEVSMLYALLKKQEKAGYIEAELEVQGTRPPKRIFNLTSLGRATFMEWVRVPVDTLEEVFGSFLVKLYFARQLGADDVEALIGRQIEICRQNLERLQSAATGGIETDEIYGKAKVFSGFDFEEEDFMQKAKRSHPRPNAHDLNRTPTPDELRYSKLVTRFRIAQTQAAIDWLTQARRELAAGIY